MTKQSIQILKEKIMNRLIEEWTYKTCDRCCYDILDEDGDVQEHYCIDNNLHLPILQ